MVGWGEGVYELELNAKAKHTPSGCVLEAVSKKAEQNVEPGLLIEMTTDSSQLLLSAYCQLAKMACEKEHGD